MGIAEFYDFYWNQQADPRTNDLPFIQSPFLIPLILLSYLYFVLKCGPRYMKDRKPYSLRTFIKWYNIFQIVTNMYIVQQLLSAGWFTEISIFCEVPDYSYNPGPLKISYTMWIGTMVKLIDLTETAVFVLRKKHDQVSFLHLYHHVTTILIAWLTTKYVPVAMASFSLLINCCVHVIMYTYYFLSSFGPSVRKVLTPIKPLITIIQMVQFVILMLQTIQSLLPSCPVVRLPGTAMVVNLMVNFYLFYDFYQKRYVKPVQKES